MSSIQGQGFTAGQNTLQRIVIMANKNNQMPLLIDDSNIADQPLLPRLITFGGIGLDGLPPVIDFHADRERLSDKRCRFAIGQFERC